MPCFITMPVAKLAKVWRRFQNDMMTVARNKITRQSLPSKNHFKCATCLCCYKNSKKYSRHRSHTDKSSTAPRGDRPPAGNVRGNGAGMLAARGGIACPPTGRTGAVGAILAAENAESEPLAIIRWMVLCMRHQVVN